MKNATSNSDCKSTSLKTLPTANYDFESLRKDDDCVYVDKTDMLYKLASVRKDAIYFISRPRRFGKSLMLSTLKCLFEGKRELFNGLKIEKKHWDWSKTYPVIHLNMSDYDKVEGLDAFEETLHDDLAGRLESAGIKFKVNAKSPVLFDALIKGLAAANRKVDENGNEIQEGRVVVLVDEYDHPLSGLLGDKPALKRMRKRLQGFYSTLKNNVGVIRFLMMTGVSKFTKLSVFSGLNNLTDLTMDEPDYAALLGYTRKEIETTLSAHLDNFAKKLGKPRTAALKELMAWYDSYRFSPYSKERVLNPVSVGRAFSNGILADYWTKTGMPTLVVERMNAYSKMPKDLEGVEAYEDDLDVCDALELPWVALLYQSGYLTIKDVVWEKQEGTEALNPKMILGAPNLEVRNHLGSCYWQSILGMREENFSAIVDVAKRQIADDDLHGLIYNSLFSLYAKLPPTWRIKNEAEAKRYFLLFISMAGGKLAPEAPSLLGYADAIIETKKNVYVFEFKFNRSAKAAVRQIREKGYADEYKNDKRPVTLIGINFKSSKRNIDEPQIEML